MRERLFCMESPTHVGNTHGVLRRGSAPAVHPHACGEYHGTIEPVGISYGSSPRVWGIRPPEKCPYPVLRFIPTRVGNTSKNTKSGGWATVHPHACGEYFLSSFTRWSYRGSSPRVWGILLTAKSNVPHPRFIPTRVGNTPVIGPAMYIFTVHPHACGEYTIGGSNGT